MKTITLKGAFAALFFVSAVQGQNQDVLIEIIQAQGNVKMLKGRGGNIAVLAGVDKVLLVDDQFADMTPKILAAVRTVSDKPVHFLLNTHWHGDHTGGNTNIGAMGTTIVAHENVRKRLKDDQTTKNLSQSDALPEITFANGLNFHFDDEEITFFHSHRGHTDGDAMVYFMTSNVLHTGDLFFNGRYPYIDLNSGGDVQGYIKSVEHALMLINEDTVIIPGHGELATKEEYQDFLEMLRYLEKNISGAIQSGKTKEAILADASLTQKYDALQFGTGFINGERIRQLFYDSLVAPLEQE
ncbi:MBL fold metallo-hydrolase [Arenibacter sp. GZD96]|uniref:MBL fold metallo-hydrolase n=1 Tax=Aurantibrevibacter litoralis TaxID=3106030 RepID=UPI002AFE2217|nr:MBL fold metallo-hydrolase [Arenibacter sp. GZD-96]MEA1787427.1 MBL fold metallo-hydrolase [Arenibacter sp. GZD-96]